MPKRLQIGEGDEGEGYLIDGRVVDEEVARTSPCTCYKLDGSDLCFSKGIIGTLTNEQEQKYCPTKIYKESEKIKRRLENFKKCVEKCKDKPLGDYLECMSKCLPKEKEIPPPKVAKPELPKLVKAFCTTVSEII